jgi:hypothetical protein
LNSIIPLFSTITDTLVTSLTCSDMDLGTNQGCTTISIISGDDTQEKFKIVGNQMLTTNTAIDYDVMTMKNFQYTLVVIATDTPSVGRTRTGTTTVIVTVEPDNEFAPSIRGILLSATVSTPLCDARHCSTCNDSDKIRYLFHHLVYVKRNF